MNGAIPNIIVSGETRTVSSDILIGVAKEFKVSTDYILGLSTVSVRKSYDISELGLSEGAVRGLVTGAVDVQIPVSYTHLDVYKRQDE